MTTSVSGAPRLVKPRMLVTAGTTLAAGLLAVSPVAGAMTGKLAIGAGSSLKAPAQVWLAASEGGEGGEGGEGVEGGEAGVSDTETDDVAYLTGPWPD